ncbi:MAG TPA: hypothetical protein VE685_08155 [Thermoanaerobaculia bacterium]|nr:hypothetical protein [Thermoanaerobaculia bacterium]
MAGKIMKLLRVARDWASDLFQVLDPCRYSILIVLVGGGAFLFVPQGQDVLQRLVEWGEEPWWRRPPLATFEIAGRWSLFLVSVLVWAVSSWYWARVFLHLRPPGSPPDTPRQARLRTWVPRLLGALALALMGAALWRAAAGYRQFSTEKPILRLQILSAACFVLAALFLRVVARRRDLLRARRAGAEMMAADAQVPSSQHLPAGTRKAARLSLLMAILLGFVFTFAPVWAGRMLGTVPILLLTAATWVLFGTGILYLSRRFRFPVLVLLLAAAVAFSFWNDNHRVRTVETADTRPPNGSIRESFRAWYRDIEGGPVFLVAAEGGGIRAAYWTAITLAEMQDRNPAFARHVFAISGISGGSLGAATFDALLAEQRERGGELPCGRLRDCAAQVLGHDFLAPVLAKAIAPDVGQRLLPFPFPLLDRAWALEDSWAAGWDDVFKSGERNRFDRPFLSLWDGDAAAIPSLVLNGTHVETGRRIVTTNLRWMAGELDDTYDLHQTLGADLPLKTAAHNSARFTYISPAGSMVKKGKLQGHVVDGGYFENSGTVTALELRRVIAKSFPQFEGKIHILYLRNAPSIDPARRRRTPAVEPTKRANRGLNDLLSPPIALLQTRNARGSLAVTTLRRTVGPEHFHELLLCKKVKDEDAPVPLPLGWQLSESARRAMEAQLPKGRPAAAPLPGGCPGFNQRNLKRIDALLSRPAASPVLRTRAPGSQGGDLASEGGRSTS